MNKLKLTNVSDGVATILVYGSIGTEVIGSQVANEIHWLNEHESEEVKEIVIKINSMGGDIVDGLSICSAILDSKIHVTTIINGMAYSIAGVIAMCGHTRKMKDYGTFMMHEVGGGGGDQNILELVGKSIAKIFEGLTPLTLEMAKELMAAETWLDADSMLERGLIDEILPTEIVKPALTNSTELLEFYNNLKTTQKKQSMKKIATHLKLTNDASEDSILDKVKSIENEADVAKSEKHTIVLENSTLKDENKELKAKLKVIEDADLAKEESVKVELINSAAKAGKITEESKESFLKSPMKSLELKNMFDGIKVVAPFVPVSTELKNSLGERSDWDFAKWSKEDPAGLVELKNSAPEEFKKISKTISIIKSKI